MIPPEISEELTPGLLARWRDYTREFLLSLVEVDQSDYTADHLLTLYGIPKSISEITDKTLGQFDVGESGQDELYFEVANLLAGDMSLANQYAYHQDAAEPDSYTPTQALRNQGRLWHNTLREIAHILDHEYKMWPSSQLAAQAILLEPKSLGGYRIIYDYVNRDKNSTHPS